MKVDLQPYATRGQAAGVRAYALLPGGLLVQFQSGEGYLYDETSPGPKHVQRMSELAIAGRGLSTYISRYVHQRYAGKFTPAEMEALQRTTR